MAFNFKNFLIGIGIIPKATLTSDSAGELEVSSSDNKLNYHNGSSRSPVLTESHQAAVQNKTLVSGTVQTVNATVTTKQLELSVSNSATASTKTTLESAQTANRTVSLPDATTTLLGHDAVQTVSNKDLVDTSVTFNNSGDATKELGVDLSGATTGTKTTLVSSQTVNRSITLPNASTTLLGTDATQTVSNKDLVDASVTFNNSSDASKELGVDLSGATASTKTTLVASQTANRSVTLPDATTTLLGTDTVQTISNKVYHADQADFYLVDGPFGTREGQFDISGVTGGQVRTLSFPDLNGTILTEAGSQVVTNKDIDGGTASNTSRLTIPKATKATLDALTRKEATLVYASDTDTLYADNGSTLLAIGGSWTTYSTESVTNGGNVTISTTVGLQVRRVQGSGGSATLSSTPLGSSAPTDGTVVRLVGQSDTNTIVITNSDTAKGAILNGDVVLSKYSTIDLQYDSVNDRWIEVARNQ